MTSLPTPPQIKAIALARGYTERREEASYTLFFKDNQEPHPTLVNVFYTTGGVMTKLNHPTSGYNELWRSGAYNNVASLGAIFANPRLHTGQGYRQADTATRGCAKCGTNKKRADFSGNQWRKGPGDSKCTGCVQQGQSDGGTTALVAADDWRSLVDSITCDAEGCNNSSPTVRCLTCQMVYYCSDECQDRHRSAHSQECISLEVFRSRSQGEDPNVNSGLCNARASTLQRMRGFAMVTQLSGRQSFDILLSQAEAINQADKDWEGAINLYMQIMTYYEQDQGTPTQWRQVWMGFSRCFYELGQYDQAMNAGEAAILMNRHFPHIHKYVALSQRDSGDLAAAITTMKNAVLYEAPWSDEIAQANKALLLEVSSGR